MTLNDIYNDIDFICQTASDPLSYPEIDKLRNVNRWYHKAQELIIDNMNDWYFQGDYTTCDLVKDQEEYTFPSDILKLNKVEINYTGGDNDWLIARQVPIERIKYPLSNKDEVYTKTSPIFFLPDTLSIAIRPRPDNNIAKGLKIYYQKDITELSQDTDKPSLAEPFHRILSLGASLDYVIANQILEKRNTIKSELNELLDRLVVYYSHRNAVSKARIIPRFSDYK